VQLQVALFVIFALLFQSLLGKVECKTDNRFRRQANANSEDSLVKHLSAGFKPPALSHCDYDAFTDRAINRANKIYQQYLKCKSSSTANASLRICCQRKRQIQGKIERLHTVRPLALIPHFTPIRVAFFLSLFSLHVIFTLSTCVCSTSRCHWPVRSELGPVSSEQPTILSASRIWLASYTARP
jgi:hypothetical protein